MMPMRTAALAFAALLALLPGAARSQRDRGRPIILLLHGRGLLDRDSTAARRDWTGALTEGANAAAHSVPFGDQDVRVVWYADALDPRSSVGCSYDAKDPRALRDARSDAGLKSLLSLAGNLLGALSTSATDREASAEARGLAADASFLSDVHRRCAAEQRLADALGRAKREGRPVTLVAHSLGSVLAYDYLSSLGAGDSPLVQHLVTVGSPLGAPELQRLLIGGDSTDVLAKPVAVRDWINIRHSADDLAAPLTVARDMTADLPTGEGNAHELVGYLRGSVVAREILNGWCDAFTTDRPQGCNGLAVR
jgi:hypothetical protein